MVEVLVAAGIGVIITLSMAQLMVTMQHNENGTKFRSDADSTNDEMRSLLSGPTACTNSFGGLVSAPGSTYNISQLKDSNGKVIYQVGGVYGDRSLNLLSMTLTSYVAGTSATTSSMTLNTSYGTKKVASGTQMLARSIQVEIEKDATTNQISSCIATAKMSDGIWQRSAANLNNIFYSAPSTGGLVGIGTGTPKAKFHLWGGDALFSDQPLANYSSSRSATQVYLDNIRAASDNGIRLYDGNTLAHLHLGNAGFTYMQSYGVNSIGPGTMGSSTVDYDDVTNFSNISLNPLGGLVGIGLVTPSTGELEINQPTNQNIMATTWRRGSNILNLDAGVGGGPGGYPISFESNVNLMLTASTSTYPYELNVATNGNVGINSSTPGRSLTVYSANDNVGAEIHSGAGSLLDVVSDSGGKGAGIRFNGAGIPHKWSIGAKANLNNSPFAIVSDYDDYIGNAPDTSVKMMIGYGGYVGVGTTVPYTKFDVRTRTNSTEGLSLISNAFTSLLVMPDLGAGSYNGLTQSGDAGVIFSKGGVGSGGMVIGPWSNAAGGAGIRIDNAGNVGIGSQTPAASLDIRGSFKSDVSQTMPGVGYFSFAQAGVGATIDINYDGGSDSQFYFTHNGSRNSGATHFIWQNGSNDIELMTITNLGRLGVSNMSPSYTLDVNGDANSNGCFRSYGAQVAGTCASDARLKTDIQNFPLGLPELLQIQPRIYKLNGLAGTEAGKEEVGFVAQELEKAIPSLVQPREVKMKPTDEKTTEIKTVNYSRFIYIVINAIKELYAQITGLDARLNALEQQNAQLKALVCQTHSAEPVCQTGRP